MSLRNAFSAWLSRLYVQTLVNVQRRYHHQYLVLYYRLEFYVERLRVLMTMTATAMMKEQQQAVVAASSLGTDILQDASGPEEEVVFSDSDDDDDDPPPSLTKSVTSPSTPTPTTTKKKKKHQKKKRNQKQNDKTATMDENDNPNDDDVDIDDTPTLGLRRKLDYSPTVQELRAKKGSEERKLLGDLQAIRMRSVAALLPFTSDHNNNNNNGREDCHDVVTRRIIAQKQQQKRRPFRWIWNVLALMLLLFLFFGAALVYRHPTLPRQLHDYVQAVPHARSFQLRMEAAEQQLWQSLTDSSFLQAELESMKEQAQENRRHRQMAQAKLKSTEQELQSALLLLLQQASSNDTSKQDIEVLQTQLQQAVVAREKAEAELQQQKGQLSDLLQKYNSERGLCKALEMEKEQAVAKAKEYRQQLEIMQERASAERKTTMNQDPQEIADRRRVEEEERIQQELQQLREEHERQMRQELQQQREQEELEVQREMGVVRQELQAKIRDELQQLRVEEEQRLQSESRERNQKLQDDPSHETGDTKVRSKTVDRVQQVVKTLNSQVEKAQQTLVSSSEALVAAKVQSPEAALLKGSFAEGESVFAVPRVLKEDLPRFVKSTKMEVEASFLHFSEVGFRGVSKEVGEKAVAGVAEAASRSIAVANATINVAKTVIEWEPMRKSAQGVQKSAEHASKSLSSVHVQSTQSSMLKGAFKEGEPLFTMPAAIGNFGQKVSQLTQSAAMGVASSTKAGFQYAKIHAGTVQNQMEKSFIAVFAESNRQFVQTKEIVAAQTEALRKNMEVRVEDIAIAGTGKLDRGKDSLDMVGHAVGDQAKIASEKVITATNEVWKMSKSKVADISKQGVNVTSVALAETTKVVSQAARATESYVTKQAADIASSSLQLMTTAGELGKSSGDIVRRNVVASVSRSQKAIEKAVRTGEAAGYKIKLQGALILTDSSKSAMNALDESRKKTTDIVRKGKAVLGYNLKKVMSHGGAFAQKSSRAVRKGLAVVMRGSKTLGRKAGATLGKAARKIAATTMKLRKQSATLVGKDLKTDMKKASRAVGKSILEGGERAMEGRQKLQLGFQEMLKRGAANAPKVGKALLDSWGILRENAVVSRKKIAKGLAQMTREFAVKTQTAVKSVQQKLSNDGNGDNKPEITAAEKFNDGGYGLDDKKESPVASLDTQGDDGDYAEEAPSLDAANEWGEEGRFKSYLNDGVILTEPDGGPPSEIPSTLQRDGSNDDGILLPEVERGDTIYDEGMEPQEENHHSVSDDELSY